MRWVYLRSDAFEDELPDGKSWIGVEPALGGSERGAARVRTDARKQLDLLRAVSDDFEELGKIELSGVPTTAYRSTIDSDRFADQLRREGSEEDAEEYEQIASLSSTDPEVTVWIDDHGILRRTRTVMEMPDVNDGPTVTMDIQVEFYDFGISPVIDLPDRDDVWDVTEQAREQLGLPADQDGSAGEPASRTRSRGLLTSQLRPKQRPLDDHRPRSPAAGLDMPASRPTRVWPWRLRPREVRSSSSRRPPRRTAVR